MAYGMAYGISMAYGVTYGMAQDMAMAYLKGISETSVQYLFRITVEWLMLHSNIYT